VRPAIFPQEGRLASVSTIILKTYTDSEMGLLPQSFQNSA
jgi:hypothetical protein